MKTFLSNLRWLVVDETVGHERMLSWRLQRLLPDLEDVFWHPRGGAYARVAVPVGTEDEALDLLAQKRFEGIIAGPGMIALFVIEGVASTNTTSRTEQDRALLAAFRRGERRFGATQKSGV